MNPSSPKQSSKAVPFRDVLEDELDEILRSRSKRGVPESRGSAEELKGNDPCEKALNAGMIGLAFSGGGIRSATFSLGVLQGLSKCWPTEGRSKTNESLLHAVDYLSTVSGGGYIGSWLHAWIKRTPGGVEEVARQLAEPAAARGPGAPDIPHDAPRPVHFLRRYANYLTPKTGLLSADTWTMISVWIRNTLLNQIILLLTFASLLLIPRVIFPLVGFFSGNIPGETTGTLADVIGLGLTVTLVFLSVLIIGLNLSSFGTGRTWLAKAARYLGFDIQRGGVRWYHRSSLIQITVALPILVVAFLASAYFRPFLQTQEKLGAAVIFIASLIFFFLCLASFVGGLERGFVTKRGSSTIVAVLALLAVNLFAAAAAGGALFVLGRLLATVDDPNRWHTLAWGTPAMVLVITLAVVIHLGLLGRNFPDERREWWSRLGAHLTIYCIAWTVIVPTAIYGPLFLLYLHTYLNDAWASGALMGWAGTVAAGLWASNSTKMGDPSERQPLGMRIVVAMAPPVFIVGIIQLLALLLHVVALQRTAFTMSPQLAQLCEHQAIGCPELPSSEFLVEYHYALLTNLSNSSWPAILAVAVFLLTASFLLAWRVDINEFALHQFYRNRLVRCYLGASRDHDRRPNLFTGFDPDDDLPVAELRTQDDKPHIGPYAIFNTALNLVHGENLAWQERKAESFVFTPLYCGFDVENSRSTHPVATRTLDKFGYRPTSSFSTKGGPQVGQAVAISGAAASPNSGFHSSPASAFLMTLFDVRLGWWIGNPRHKHQWRSSSPTLGLLYLLYELMGMTDDRRGFVYLSDGGHFENLALYELVRRRCRYIIVCDGEQDGEFKFEGLGNAIRKCRTDFGVEIDVNVDRLRPDPETKLSGTHCVVGTVRYPERDPRDGRMVVGTLVYIKASVTGDEPSDVLEYKRRDPGFPHTPTSDQWFDESQFESYRRLGLHAANTVFRNVAEDVPLASRREDFFRRLQQQWYPPSRAVQGKFTEHTRALIELMERLRSDSDLHFMHGQISGEWNTLMKQAIDAGQPQNWLPHRERELRAGFHFCNSIIQLMENVYLDLNLEEEWNHPDTRGWMNLFNNWVWSSMFRVTWAASAACYGARFQTFCQKRLQLPLGELTTTLGDVDDLNFYERMRFEQRGEKTDRVWRLELRVKNPTGGEDFIAYRFGFALVDANQQLRFYRVQNHLRKMGLWTAIKPILWKNAGLRGEEVRQANRASASGTSGLEAR